MLLHITASSSDKDRVALPHVEKVLAPNGSTRRQALFPEPPPSEAQGSTNSSGTQIKYRKGVRRITLQRLICSRLVFRLERVTLDELLVLYDNFLACQDLAVGNEGFRQKFGKSLEDLSNILKAANLTQEDPSRVAKMFSRRFKRDIPGFLIPERNLSQSEKHLEKSYRLLPTRDPGTERRYIPPKTFVGVGYRDKGSRRDSARDGSPSWQEVAMSMRLFSKGAYHDN